MVVLGWLKDHPNSYKISIEVEFQEVKEGKEAKCSPAGL